MLTKIVISSPVPETAQRAAALAKVELGGCPIEIIIACGVPTENNMPLSKARDRFDAVFCLVPPGNTLRFVEGWVGHPHLRVIGLESGFEISMARLIDEIKAFIGIPEPREIERKFLIKHPDIDMLESMPLCRAVEISQTYIIMPDGERARVRSRGTGDGCVYFKTVKRELTNISRIENECRISADEYRSLLKFADASRKTIEKRRYCLVWKNQYFELDIFEFWKKQSFLEIELLSESQPVELPDFIEVIRELTGDKRYTNSALALSVPDEE